MVQNLIKEDNPDPVETDKKGSNPHCKPLETDTKETEKNLEANSYKFARPRVYVQNNYESAEISAVDHLKYERFTLYPFESSHEGSWKCLT